MIFRLSDLNPVTSSVADDILHLRNSAGLDKKITNTNLFKSIPEAAILGLLEALGGLNTGEISEAVADEGITINNEMKVDVISEKTSDAGVTIDSVNLKDGIITGTKVNTGYGNYEVVPEPAFTDGTTTAAGYTLAAASLKQTKFHTHRNTDFSDSNPIYLPSSGTYAYAYVDSSGNAGSNNSAAGGTALQANLGDRDYRLIIYRRIA